MWALAGVLLLGAFIAPARVEAAAPKDKREMHAREAYAAGRYKEALDIFVTLYAETVHPNYLRNIGRCYQNLNQPEPALSSFREYLRKARDLSAQEREEIRGYMKEMEELKRQQAAAPPPPPPRTEEPKPPLPPVGSTGNALTDGNPKDRPPVVAGGGPQPPPAQDEASPIYTRWWFWGIVAGVVAAGVIGGVLATRSSAKDPMCGPDRKCDP